MRSFFSYVNIFQISTLRDKQYLVYLLLIPIISIIFWNFTFSYKGMGAIIVIVTTTLTIIILGRVHFASRKTTIYDNMKISGFSKSIIYFYNFIICFAIVVILFGYFWLIIFIFGKLSLLRIYPLEGLQNYYRNSIDIFKYNIICPIFALTIPTTLVCFSVFFIVFQFSPNFRIYFIVVLSLFIINLFFGSTINNISNANGGTYINIFPSSGKDGLIIVNVFDSDNIMLHLLYPSVLLNPFYGICQTGHNITLYSAESFRYEQILNNNITSSNQLSMNFVFNSFYFSDDIEFNHIFGLEAKLILLQPYLYSLSLVFVGSIISFIRKK